MCPSFHSGGEYEAASDRFPCHAVSNSTVIHTAQSSGRTFFHFGSFTIGRIVKERANEISRQDIFSNIKDLGSLKYYREVKQFWEQEEYVRLNSRKERTGMAWWRLGIWRLKNKRGNVQKDKCPLYGLAEDAMHIALKSFYRRCPGTTGSLGLPPWNVTKRRWMASTTSTRGGSTRGRSFASDRQGGPLEKLPKQE
ncbi:hypothetical protein ANN_06641 [Periplaneta americana]|uniref:Uncharacterized protein n=1 Tax=Periplaneta americana TaxID=6978 RepID=A0ABQ8TFW0_PERAM|nr:hypothetical protein ANN_06641 [Periplaneta americana]